MKTRNLKLGSRCWLQVSSGDGLWFLTNSKGDRHELPFAIGHEDRKWAHVWYLLLGRLAVRVGILRKSSGQPEHT